MVNYSFDIKDPNPNDFDLALVLSLELSAFSYNGTYEHCVYDYYVALIDDNRNIKVSADRVKRVKGFSTEELLTSANPHVRKVGRERLAKKIQEYKKLLVESGYYERK